GPVPRRPRRRWPPLPTWGPFLVPGLRTAPRRLELPAIFVSSHAPAHAVGAVLHGDSGGGELIAQCIGTGKITFGASTGAFVQQVFHQRGQGSAGGVLAPSPAGPRLRQRIQAEHGQP